MFTIHYYIPAQNGESSDFGTRSFDDAVEATAFEAEVKAKGGSTNYAR